MTACSTPPAAGVSAPSPQSSIASGPTWKSDAILDFPNHQVGDLELIAGNLMVLSGQGTTVTGTDIIAIDPQTGRTRWTDTTLNDLVPPGDSSFHFAHYLTYGDDMIVLVTDGSLEKSAVVRFSVPTRRVIWQLNVNGVLFPESLSVHGSMICFAGQGPVSQTSASSITCLNQDGKSLWTRNLGQSEVDWVEIEIATSKLMVLASQPPSPSQGMAWILDIRTGESTIAPFQVDARFGDVAVRHLAGWKDDKVLAFVTDGIAVFDLSSPQRRPQRLIPLTGQFPRAPEIAQGGSTVYVKYDLPQPTGGDQPMADVVAAFGLDSGTKLWEKTDAADPQLERMRPMRLQGSDLLYGDDIGGVWVLAARTGAVKRQYPPALSPSGFLQRVAPLRYGNGVILSENFGPGPLDYRLAAIP